MVGLPEKLAKTIVCLCAVESSSPDISPIPGLAWSWKHLDLGKHQTPLEQKSAPLTRTSEPLGTDIFVVVPFLNICFFHPCHTHRILAQSPDIQCKGSCLSTIMRVEQRLSLPRGRRVFKTRRLTTTERNPVQGGRLHALRRRRRSLRHRIRQRGWGGWRGRHPQRLHSQPVRQ